MSTTVGAAVTVEFVKLARSATGRLATVLLGVAVPLLAAGLVVAASGGGGPSQLAVKARMLVPGVGWDGLTSATGQVLSIAMLLGAGFVVSWTFGREFSDGTIEALLMASPSRFVLASAKLAVTLGWAIATSIGSAVCCLVLGLLLGMSAGTPWTGLARMLIGAVLTALLATPFALVATLARSTVAGVGAVIGVIVATQILTTVGTGGWFPYAAPSLWLGMGGPQVSVTSMQLSLVLLVAATGWVATALSWQHRELLNL